MSDFWLPLICKKETCSASEERREELCVSKDYGNGSVESGEVSDNSNKLSGDGAHSKINHYINNQFNSLIKLKMGKSNLTEN